MLIDSDHLATLMAEIAAEQFGPKTFERRDLMKRTEWRLKKTGLWQESDDAASASADGKSVGLADIDWRFTDLANAGVSTRVSHGVWKLTRYEARQDGD